MNLMPPTTDLQQAFLARIVDAAVADERVFACWTEGDTPQGCFPPFAGAIDLHFGTPEPTFDALVADHAKLLGAAGKVVSHHDTDVPVNARACAAELDVSARGLPAALGTAQAGGGVRVLLTIERMSLVTKRPRVCIAPLVDKTQQLRYAMDYSKRAGSPTASGSR